MEPHRESTDGSNTCPASTLLSSYSQVFLVFFLQVQIPCYILISCATFQVRRAGSLSVVPVQHCCLEEDPSRPTISFPWPVLCVVDSLSLILVGHSKRKTHETMKRRQVHHTSTSNDFHAALFVDEYPRPSIDVCSIGNSLTLNTNLAELPLSVQLWVNKLSKSYQHFLNLLVKEKQLWQVNVLSPSMPLYGTLSLFRTSSAGCYAFPCVSLVCDVSTCKPYTRFHEHYTIFSRALSEIFGHVSILLYFVVAEAIWSRNRNISLQHAVQTGCSLCCRIKSRRSDCNWRSPSWSTPENHSLKRHIQPGGWRPSRSHCLQDSARGFNSRRQ